MADTSQYPDDNTLPEMSLMSDQIGIIDHEEALRPATLRQVQDATRAHSTAPFTIEGTPVNYLVIVAMLRYERFNVTAGQRKATYDLDDGTAKMTGWRKLEPKLQNATQAAHIADPDWQSRARITSGNPPKLCYVRIVAKIVDWRERHYLDVISVHKVEAFNEVLHHLLAAAVATTWSRQGPPSSDIIEEARNPAAQNASSGPAQSNSQSQQAPPPTAPRTQPTQSPDSEASGRDSDSGWVHVAAAVKETRKPSAAQPFASSSKKEPSGSAHISRSPPSTPAAPKAEQKGMFRPAPPSSSPITGSSGSARPAPPYPAARDAEASAPSQQGKGKGVDRSYATGPSSPTPHAREGRSSPKPEAVVSSTAPPESSRARSPANHLVASASTPKTPTRRTPARDPGTPHLTLSPRDPLSKLSGLQRQIMIEILDDEASDPSKGTHVSKITTRLKDWKNITTEEMCNALDALEEEGYIHQTVTSGIFYQASGQVGYRRVNDLVA